MGHYVNNDETNKSTQIPTPNDSEKSYTTDNTCSSENTIDKIFELKKYFKPSEKNKTSVKVVNINYHFCSFKELFMICSTNRSKYKMNSRSKYKHSILPTHKE